MVWIEAFTYGAMLVCLFRVWPRLRLFIILETLVFLEWPVQEVVNRLSLHLGYRLWFWFDQIDILVGVLCAMLVWEEIPLAGWLIALQQFVVMAHYLLMDSVHDFWHRGAWLFWVAKWLDIFINCAVIWGIIRPNLLNQKEPHHERPESERAAEACPSQLPSASVRRASGRQ